MSELTFTEPEVLTDHTDVICSTSIERIVTGRNNALECIDTLIQQLDTISQVTTSIWRDLMNKSGTIALMDAQARDEWYDSLEKDDIPTISKDNIVSTFEQHQNKAKSLSAGSLTYLKG